MLSSSQRHVLLIDDAPELLGSLIAALRQQDWRVSLAKDGHEGFHRAQALVPDIILLDVFMPRLGGFATCRLLKESPRTCDIPIIFLSTAGDGDDRLAGLQSGSVDYVTKPCLPAEVVARIRIHLQQETHAPVAAQTGPMPLLTDGEVLLRAAMRLLSANLAELPPLTEIAHQVGTYDKKLSAIFRRHLGVTVFAWVREERLRVARDWLAESHMSVADIADQVGFHSAANFATAFRQRLGVTPSQYRKNLQQADRNAEFDAK